MDLVVFWCIVRGSGILVRFVYIFVYLLVILGSHYAYFTILTLLTYLLTLLTLLYLLTLLTYLLAYFTYILTDLLTYLLTYLLDSLDAGIRERNNQMLLHEIDAEIRRVVSRRTRDETESVACSA